MLLKQISEMQELVDFDWGESLSQIDASSLLGAGMMATGAIKGGESVLKWPIRMSSDSLLRRRAQRFQAEAADARKTLEQTGHDLDRLGSAYHPHADALWEHIKSYPQSAPFGEAIREKNAADIDKILQDSTRRKQLEAKNGAVAKWIRRYEELREVDKAHVQAIEDRAQTGFRATKDFPPERTGSQIAASASVFIVTPVSPILLLISS